MPAKTVFSVCGMCPVRCPIEVDVTNGECRFIQGNRQVPSIRGALCTRGGAGIPFVRDDERPQFPMLRQGERGEGRWQRLSWEEAFSAHLRAHDLSGARRMLEVQSLLTPEPVDREALRARFESEEARHRDELRKRLNKAQHDLSLTL